MNNAIKVFEIEEDDVEVDPNGVRTIVGTKLFFREIWTVNIETQVGYLHSTTHKEREANYKGWPKDCPFHLVVEHFDRRYPSYNLIEVSPEDAEEYAFFNMM